MIQRYFRSLYRQTMASAYGKAYQLIGETTAADGLVLDCGAGSGSSFDRLQAVRPLGSGRYRGIEWDADLVLQARSRQLQVAQGDLNKTLPFGDAELVCVYGLSVLEHLLHPCHFLRECRRVLRPGGRLVLLTPNISTYFTVALLLAGRMPSSGPHPDSNALQRHGEVFRVAAHAADASVEGDTPQHRHLIVFSFRVLRDYLRLLGFVDVRGYGFGLYPFPNWSQPVLQRIDPYHCHQMVFAATCPDV